MRANNKKVTAYYFRNEEHRVCLNANEPTGLIVDHIQAETLSNIFAWYYLNSTSGFHPNAMMNNEAYAQLNHKWKPISLSIFSLQSIVLSIH
jgi:hypothetical protein